MLTLLKTWKSEISGTQRKLSIKVPATAIENTLIPHC